MWRAAAVLACAAAACGGGASGWSAPATLDERGGAHAPDGVALRMDASGNAVALWRPARGASGFGVTAVRFDAGTRTWGAPARLEADGAGSAGDADLAAGANAVAVWLQTSAGAQSVWSSWLDAAGSAWHAPALVEIDDTGDAGEPCLAAAPGGGAVALWHQWDGLRESLWAARLEGAPVAWSRRELLETTDSADARAPDVAVDPAGNAVAVWTQTDDDGGAFVWSAGRAAGATAWSAPSMISTVGTSPPAPRVALDAAGDGLAVWARVAGGVSTIWASRYHAATSSWDEATLVAADDRGQALAPELALDARGDAFVAWLLRGETSSSVWASRLGKQDGARQRPARLDVEGDGDDARTPTVAAAGEGQAVVVWRQRDGVRASRFDARTGAWGDPAPLDGLSADGARVALDAAGNAIAVWARVSGPSSQLVGARQAR